jgi:hypothetical protein
MTFQDNLWYRLEGNVRAMVKIERKAQAKQLKTVFIFFSIKILAIHFKTLRKSKRFYYP